MCQPDSLITLNERNQTLKYVQYDPPYVKSEKADCYRDKKRVSGCLWTARGCKRDFGGEEDVLYLDCDGSFTNKSVNTHQIIHFKWTQFICKLFLTVTGKIFL